jgi:serine/threonine-protein kinase RsbT
VRSFSAGLGFTRIAQGELIIAASELASNILKYAGRGEVVLRRVVDPAGRIGIEIAAHDHGPPIVDFEAALRDGWSEGGPIDPALLLRRRGIGAGLGAVARFSDRLYYQPSEGSGKSIVAQRFIRRKGSLPPKRRGKG